MGALGQYGFDNLNRLSGQPDFFAHGREIYIGWKYLSNDATTEFFMAGVTWQYPPLVSTATVEDRITVYIPLVATTEFAANFPVFQNADLIVIHDQDGCTNFVIWA